MTDHRAVREQVRLLWIANGYNLTLAAQQANVPYRRAQKWLQRGHWEAQKPARQTPSHFVSEAADKLQEEISTNGQQTRLSLSRASLRLARGQEHTGSPKETLQTAQGAAIIHGWKDREEKESGLTLNILNVNQVVSPQ